MYPKDASGMANIIRPGLEEKWGIDLAIPGLVVQCVIQKMNCCNNCWHFNIYEQKNSIQCLSEPEKCLIS